MEPKKVQSLSPSQADLTHTEANKLEMERSGKKSVFEMVSLSPRNVRNVLFVRDDAEWKGMCES